MLLSCSINLYQNHKQHRERYDEWMMLKCLTSKETAYKLNRTKHNTDEFTSVTPYDKTSWR